MEERDDVVREQPSVYGDQDAFGNDLSILRQNLLLSPTERLRRAASAIEGIKRLKGAGKRIR